jgi:hypothetical protein
VESFMDNFMKVRTFQSNLQKSGEVSCNGISVGQKQNPKKTCTDLRNDNIGAGLEATVKKSWPFSVERQEVGLHSTLQQNW